MKTGSSDLTALLTTRQFYAVDLFQFTLVDGTILRYAGGDKDITYGGNTYSCGGAVGPFFQTRTGRGLCKWKIGVEVDTLQFDVLPGTSTVEGFDFLVACKFGIFDGAEMILYRAFMPTYGDTSAGLVNIFTGRVVEIDCGRSLATFNINSHLELLSQQMPRNLYQPGCLNTLYDSACTLVKSSFATTASASSGCTASTLNATLSQATGYFNQGTLQMTSGNNEGFQRMVKTYTNGTPSVVNVLFPFPYAISSGDTFAIYPGCDKQQTTCSSKFSNIANFRGMPYIPQPEVGV
jgi:uncharacterized phage protein (TIGR02218 family)